MALLAVLVFSGSIDLAKSEVGNFTVIIDPGHGGVDSGAIGANGVEEKDITLKIAQLVLRKSYQDPRLKVILTRYTDRYVAPYDRTEFANKRRADIFVSVHADSFGDPSIRGATTYVARKAQRQSNTLAKVVQNNLAVETRATNRGTKRASLFTREAKMPTILVEVGFLSNPTEAEKLVTPSYQHKVASALLHGIRQYVKTFHNESETSQAL